jgi:hypothetical protein
VLSGPWPACRRGAALWTQATVTSDGTLSPTITSRQRTTPLPASCHDGELDGAPGERRQPAHEDAGPLGSIVPTGGAALAYAQLAAPEPRPSFFTLEVEQATYSATLQLSNGANVEVSATAGFDLLRPSATMTGKPSGTAPLIHVVTSGGISYLEFGYLTPTDSTSDPGISSAINN